MPAAWGIVSDEPCGCRYRQVMAADPQMAAAGWMHWELVRACDGHWRVLVEADTAEAYGHPRRRRGDVERVSA